MPANYDHLLDKYEAKSRPRQFAEFGKPFLIRKALPCVCENQESTQFGTPRRPGLAPHWITMEITPEYIKTETICCWCNCTEWSGMPQ